MDNVDPFMAAFFPESQIPAIAEHMDNSNKMHMANVAALLTLLMEKGILNEEDCERFKILQARQMVEMDQLATAIKDKAIDEYKEEHKESIGLLKILGMWNDPRDEDESETTSDQEGVRGPDD